MAIITITEQTAPTTPQAGATKLFVDSADSHLKIKDSTGAVLDITATTVPTDNCRVGFFFLTTTTTVRRQHQ